MTDDRPPVLAALDDLAEPAGPRDSPKLATPRVTVTLDDGRELTTQVRNADYLRWDRTAAKHGWPAMAKAPFMWLTFVAWSALRRDGAIPDSMTWEAFSDTHALQVRTAEDDETGADPTPPGVEPG
jgi:hypothetical protein